MHLVKLSQIALPNMWLLVLIELANKLYHIKKFLISFYAICYVLLRNFVNKPVQQNSI